MQVYRLFLLAGTLGFALMLSACNETTPSQVNTSKLQVKDQVVTETLSTKHVDLKGVAAIARKALHNGNGEIALTIPYLPGEMVKAGDLGVAYQQAFVAQGVTHISVALVAMTDSEDTEQVVASYQALKVQQAEDCSRIPGYEGTDSMDDYDNYQFGCETQGDIAKMIDDPTDLLGKEDSPEASSRRNGAIIDPYMAGTPNQAFTGASASGTK